MQVIREILNLPVLNAAVMDLIDLSDQDIRDKYREIDLRYSLVLLVLLTMGGKRPSTMANITNGELYSAVELDDGSVCISVVAHKVGRFILIHM